MRSFEVYAIVKPDLSDEDSAFINSIIEEKMLTYDIKRDKDTFYHEMKLGGSDIGPCVMFFIKLNRYKEYFRLIGYNNYFQGSINITEEIAGSEYRKLSEVRWIPVSEGYPDAAGQVLITKLENEEYKIDICEYSKEYGFNKLHDKVIAWAKLPLPYFGNN